MISTGHDFTTFRDSLPWDPPTDRLLIDFVDTGGGLGPLAAVVDEGTRIRSLVELSGAACGCQ